MNDTIPEIPMGELRISTSRSKHTGGFTSRIDDTVTITHLPTRIESTAMNVESIHRARADAMGKFTEAWGKYWRGRCSPCKPPEIAEVVYLVNGSSPQHFVAVGNFDVGDKLVSVNAKDYIIDAEYDRVRAEAKQWQDIYNGVSENLTIAIKELRAAEARIAELQQPQKPKMAPVQGYVQGIPWDMHLEAYNVYCKKYGAQQALIEGGCRGGFGVRELDMFIPGWREKLSLVGKLNAEIEALRDKVKQLTPAPAYRTINELNLFEVHYTPANKPAESALKAAAMDSVGEVPHV